MAAEIHCKFGDYKGESKQKNHSGEIVVLSVSLGAHNPVSSEAVGGLSAGKPTLSELSFTKSLDSSTPKLLGDLLSGKHTDSVTFSFSKTTGDKGAPVDFMVWKLSKVFVTSVQYGSSRGETSEAENLTLACQKIEFDYKTQGADGSLKSAGTATFDATTGTLT